MGFIEGKCKKCDGMLQLPDDRESVICMYCGEKLLVAEAAAYAAETGTEAPTGEVVSADEEKAAQIRKENYNQHLTYALTHFPDILMNLEEPMQNFQKKTYEVEFEKLMEMHKETWEALHHAYMLTDDPDEMMLAVSRATAAAAAEVVRAEKNKRQQEECLNGLNMALVVYLIPLVLETHADYAGPLTDQILICWKEEFPKTNLKKATFEQINGGFRNRLCYITTTLCEGLGKVDDCHELNLMRDYRDNWLAAQPGGQNLIEEYYDIAPTIVKRMKRSENPDQLYQDVYDTYLRPCVSLLEEEKYEACKELYKNMVEDLKGQFISGYRPS